MIQKRQEGDTVPQGCSYTEPTGGRLHLWYRKGNEIVHFAVPKDWAAYIADIPRFSSRYYKRIKRKESRYEEESN